MPLRDEHGKRLSGCAQRQRAKARMEAERRAEQAAGIPLDVSMDPPPGDTAELIPWAVASLARLAYVASKVNVFASRLDQCNFIADGLAKIGMIHDKATEQARLARLAQRLGLRPATKRA